MNPKLATERPDPPGEVIAPRTRVRPHSLRARILLGLVALLALAAALVAYDAWRVAADLRAGRSELQAAVRANAWAGEGVAAPAERAARRFRRAQRIARRSPWLSAVARVPVAGRPVRWLRTAAARTADVAGLAADAAARIDAGVRAARTPAGRIAAIDVVERELAALADALSSVALPEPGWPIPPIAGADRDLRTALGRAAGTTREARDAARGLRSFLAGPARYLVLAGNNAEMRSGGMALQAGVMRTEAGRIRMSGLGSTSELTLRTSVPVPAEHAALYGWLDPGREWRNATTSPNFPAVAPMLAAMAEAAGLGPVDGVLYLDVAALRRLIGVLGPVEAGGRRYGPADVEPLVMHDLYVAFADERDERRRALGRIAAETFRALDSRSPDALRLAVALRNAAAGRHLLAWSRRTDEQRAWRSLGLDGALDRDGIMVGVQNHGGNKLDWFLRVAGDLSVERGEGGRRRYALRVDLTNPTPEGEPPYVAGDGRVAPPGTYRGLALFYLPGWATDVRVDGAPVRLVGADGPMRVIGVLLDVARGGRARLTVRFSAPPGEDRLVLLPSGRARPVTIRVGSRVVDDSRRRVLAA